MLKIEGLTADIDGKEILKGIDLEVPAGEVHAIMGPNGSGKSTLSYVLSGREGYTVTGGSVTFMGHDLLAMEPEERAVAGLFLAFQYPVELPGVGNALFLRTALNAVRRGQGLVGNLVAHRAGLGDGPVQLHAGDVLVQVAGLQDLMAQFHQCIAALFGRRAGMRGSSLDFHVDAGRAAGAQQHGLVPGNGLGRRGLA